MKSASAIIKGFIYLIFAFLGFYFLYESANFDNWKFMYEAIAFLKGASFERGFFAVTGSFFLLLLFSLFLFWLRTSHAKRALLFASPLGQIRISYSAIRDFVVETAVQNPFVETCSVVIAKQSHTIAVRILLQVYPNQNVLQISKDVQQAVKDGLSEVMGVDELAAIDVRVGSVVVEKVL